MKTYKNVLIKKMTQKETAERVAPTAFAESIYYGIIVPYAGTILKCSIDSIGNLVYEGYVIPENITFTGDELAACNVRWVEDGRDTEGI